MAKTKKKKTAASGGKTYKLIELVGTSSKGYEDAIQQAVSDASKTIKGMSWFEVVEFRGHINKGKIEEYQAKLKVGFRILSA